MSERAGDWIQVFTGGQFWPLDPRPDEIHIEDIAHSLSLQCRFAGHTLVHYSVGEHSYLLSTLCSPDNALWGLLHDAAEAYLVDLPRPIKRFSRLGEEYRTIEARLMVCICECFGLPAVCPAEVKELDNLMLQWEQRDLMALPPAQWKQHGAVLPIQTLVPFTPSENEHWFVRQFQFLWRLHCRHG